MSRLLAFTLLAGLAGLLGGCAMCCGPSDCNYPSVAGRWVRHNPTSGRVGSAFDEAGGPGDVIVATAAEEVPQPSLAPQPPLPPPTATPSPSDRGPAPRSVIPRNMGESYLPR